MKKRSIYHSTTETLRWCWCCQQYKVFSEFHKDKWKKLELDRICKLCKGPYQKEHQHKYYLKHREELLPKHRISAILSRQRRKVGA